MTSIRSAATLEECMAGRSLWGDDFSAEDVARWYQEEEQGYYQLTREQGWMDEYLYNALNQRHAYRFLKGRRFEVCVAMGCADGSDVIPLAPQVGRYVALEPAEKWWKDSLGGRPAQFLKPEVSGHIPLADNSVELVVSLGVLHHVPNVSFVLGEIGRVLRPGGFFVLREPIFSMGDWTRPRPGLTRNERGIPLGWLDATLAADFRIVRRALCCFPPILRVCDRIGWAPYNNRAMTLLDEFICRLSAWNVSYHRVSLWKRFAPSSAFYLLERR